MNNCEYVREYYKVPACIGRRVNFNGRLGTISKDGGNYVAVNFDDMKPGRTSNIHPTDPKLTYLNETAEPRKMSFKFGDKVTVKYRGLSVRAIVIKEWEPEIKAGIRIKVVLESGKKINRISYEVNIGW